MPDLPPITVPDENDLAQQVAFLTNVIVGHGSNLGQAPAGLNGLDLQEWNIGQLTQKLGQRPSVQQIVGMAKQMWPDYDRLPPDQQRVARDMANVALFAQLNMQSAALGQGANTPGSISQPNVILDAEARSKYGFDAWALDIPELRVILEQAAAGGWDQTQLTAALESTQWYRTHTQAQQQFATLREQNPEDYNFADSGSLASKMLLQVQNDLSKAGVNNFDLNRLQDMAMKALEYGWNDQQIMSAVASEAKYNPAAGNNQMGQGVVDQLQGLAAAYFVNLSPDSLQQWAQQITAGTQSQQTFNSYLKQQALAKYPGMANQLNEGLTVQQVTDPYRQEASQLMELSPTQIDFQKDPFYSQILSYVPPGESDARMMTMSEMNKYLRSSSQWSYTQQARDQVGTQVSSILKTFGVVAQ